MDVKPLGPVQANVAPEAVELAERLMLSPTHTERDPETVMDGTGEPVMQEKPERIFAPGCVPNPFVKLTPVATTWQ